jgi:hypothetical protein
MTVFVEEYLRRRRRDEDDCIIVEHGALMEYDRSIFGFLESFVSIAKICCFDVFNHIFIIGF